ncbi:MAG TPA: T9SS type A sorting domain-containing protein [Parafilimonas sp.]|nr:T9SS type A sorting domain-containing protein [Parafilimonas sp.]
MRTLLLFVLLGICVNLHAQYFQRYFNEVVTAPPKRVEAFSDGLKSRANYGGGIPTKYYFAATGSSELSPTPPTGTDARLRLVRTTSNGTVAVNNGYQFGDVSPKWYESRGNGICEVFNGAGTGGYVVVGQVSDNPAANARGIAGGSDIFFGMFNNGGNSTSRERIDVNGGFDVATGVIRSRFIKGTFLLCGYSNHGNYTDAVVARISSSGAVLWLRSVDLLAAGVTCGTTSKAIANSICEDSLSGYIYVCGRVSGHKQAQDQDGFVFQVTPAGAPTWAMSHDQAGATDEYRDIKFTSTGGILVCGFSNVPAQGVGAFNDVWLSLFTPAGVLTWTYKHRFSSPLQETKGYRVIEGKYLAGSGTRYYVVGSIYPSVGGSPYQMMLEIFGGGVGGGTYHVYPPPYGPLGVSDRFGLDSVEMNMPSPGLMIFSSTVQPPTGLLSNSYMLKTYYNGATCKDFCTSYPDAFISVYPSSQMAFCVDTSYKTQKMKYITYKYDSATICSEKKVKCGSNNTPLGEAVQEETPVGNEMRLTPNPANSILNIGLTVFKDGSYKAEVIDVNGRAMMSSVVQLRAGNSSANINVGTLRKGYYTLRLTGDGKVWTKQFMKE